MSQREDGRTASSERTRAKLLAAAMEEFAERGYAGARVASIARRAGVNKQLISYHFGGKRGLYDQLLAQWRTTESAWRRDESSLGDLVARYLDHTLANPEGVRLSAQQLLDSSFPQATTPDEDELADLRRRQDAGELAPDLDVAAVQLAVMGMVTAPVLIGTDLIGGDVDSYRRTVLRLVASLEPVAADRR